MNTPRASETVGQHAVRYEFIWPVGIFLYAIAAFVGMAVIQPDFPHQTVSEYPNCAV